MESSRIWIVPLLAAIAAGSSFSQTPKADYSPEHLCSRCHLHDMLEWSISAHNEGGADCIVCHGPSEGHLIDERNNVKPDHVPRGAEVADLCLNCHQSGCPPEERDDACETCHHSHGLVDIRERVDGRPAAAPSPVADDGFNAAMERGKELIASSDWHGALR
ncbi:MAG: hypothetical protein GY953_00620, partial [bacterium]|nr:hypothetical protein [bacterium]